MKYEAEKMTPVTSGWAGQTNKTVPYTDAQCSVELVREEPASMRTLLRREGDMLADIHAKVTAIGTSLAHLHNDGTAVKLATELEDPDMYELMLRYDTMLVEICDMLHTITDVIG